MEILDGIEEENEEEEPSWSNHQITCYNISLVEFMWFNEPNAKDQWVSQLYHHFNGHIQLRRKGYNYLMHYHKYHLPCTIEIYLLCHNLLFFDPLKIVKIFFSMDQQTAHGPPQHMLESFLWTVHAPLLTHCSHTLFMHHFHVHFTLRLYQAEEKERWKGGSILTGKWISNPQSLLYISFVKKRREKKRTYI